MKNMNTKMTTNNCKQPNLKKNKKKPQNEVSKQLDQEQNQRNGDHMEGYQWGREGGEWWKRHKE